MNAPATTLPAVPAEAHTTTRVSTVDVFSSPAAFEHAQRVAKVFAASALVPQHLRDNVADCLIAYHVAQRLGEDPLVVMQNIYVVSGRPGWKTEYVIARARRAGVFRGPIRWRTSNAGAELAVTAYAVLADTDDEVTATADMRMAKAEGWTKNPKYASMPEHMLRWRSAAMLVRLYCPEVMLGLPIVEEIETIPASSAPRDITPPKTVNDALDAFAAGARPDRAGEETSDPDTGEIIDTAAEVAHEDPTVPLETDPPEADEAPADPLAAIPPARREELLEIGRRAARISRKRSAAVPPDLREDPDFAALVLQGYDEAARELEAGR